MKSEINFFKKNKVLAIDEFFRRVLYDRKIGYYTSKNPFGAAGDFLTAPKISKLFSEMIAIWIISTWEFFDKPKKLNIIELGPGDGSLMKIILDVFKNFPEINSAKKIYLYETSEYLERKQKINLKNYEVKWIKNFSSIKKGPVIFFGNEFFDAIPIKQFKKSKNNLFEKHFTLENNYRLKEFFKKASTKDTKTIKSFKTLKKLRFIEFPKLGFVELKKVTKLICKLKGCILLVDYGYIVPNNQNTLQSVFKHKKNPLLNNLGKADITSHVNFSLLNEFFVKNSLQVKKTVTQKEFLEQMGIIERAEIIARKMKFNEKSDLYLRLKRLLSPNLMGDLFKVNLAYKFKNNKYFGFK